MLDVLSDREKNRTAVPVLPPLSEPIYRFEIKAVVAQNLFCGTFSGSMIRGAFGHALRERHCHCPRADHDATCLYARVFEGLGGGGKGNPPPRFVITPPARRRLKAGEVMAFQLTLFSLTEHETAQALDALVLGLARGLGGRTRTPVEVVAIEGLPMMWTPLASRVTLKLTTPWLIKYQGRWLNSREVDAEQLLHAAARRLSVLNSHFGLLRDLPDYEAIRHCLSGASVSLNLADHTEQRRSARQGKAHPLAGVMGTVHIRHEQPDGLRPLTYPLNLIRWLHGGGKCSMGLGGLELE